MDREELKRQWANDAEEQELEKERIAAENKKIREEKRAIKDAEKKHARDVRRHIREQYNFFKTRIVNHQAWIISNENKCKRLEVRNQIILDEFKDCSDKRLIFKLGAEYGANKAEIKHLKAQIHLWDHSISVDKPAMFRFEEQLLKLKK